MWITLTLTFDPGARQDVYVSRSERPRIVALYKYEDIPIDPREIAVEKIPYASNLK
jgi:hypothetical protein